MKPKKNNILVRVDLQQKDAVKVGEISFFLPTKYMSNHREKNPIACVVVDGNKVIKKDTILLCHHNLFRPDSPYCVYDNLFSIPINRQIFVMIDQNGEPHGMYGNIIAERIEQNSFFDIPPSYRKNYNDRVTVLSGGHGLMKGEEILTYTMADYEIVYIWQGIEKRIIRVFFEDIVAVIEK